MPFEVIRNDITKMQVDAIVNSANPLPVVGLGTDSRIHEAAGPKLLAARQKIGPIAVGCAAITPAYQLPANYVIHTVAPVWDGGIHGEEALLKNCYLQSLHLAQRHCCRSIAFPLIASNNCGFPKDRALQIAISAFSDFLLNADMLIYLVVFHQDAYRLSEKLFQKVTSYIDQHYVDLQERVVYGPEGNTRRQQLSRQAELKSLQPWAQEEDAVPYASMTAPTAAPMAAIPSSHSLEEILGQEDAGFTETLLRFIDRSGKKDSVIYKRAGLTKQHFSKIKNNPRYQPTKPTAIALALALELDLEDTRDLIGRAGFALTNSSKFDLIIRYFIENRSYNVVEINCVLFEHDQSLLGS